MRTTWSQIEEARARAVNPKTLSSPRKRKHKEQQATSDDLARLKLDTEAWKRGYGQELLAADVVRSGAGQSDQRCCSQIAAWCIPVKRAT